MTRIAAAATFCITVAAVVCASLVNSATVGASSPRLAQDRSAAAANPPPFTLVHEALPDGADGVYYSAILATKGGVPACTWFLQGRMPDGLQIESGLTCQAQIVGIPARTDRGTYHLQVQVYDNIQRRTSASLSIKIGNSHAAGPRVDPIPPRSPNLSLINPPIESRPSWSGYVVTGRSLGPVTGTFTIPYITTSAAACADQLGVWVGLDGADSVPGGTSSSLIQAGIGEGLSNPLNGTCTPGHFYLWPWWEILPGPESPIFTMTLDVGDRVTVRIWHADKSNWYIRMRDDTTGEEFTTHGSYAGPSGTAEWIVEATEVPGLCGPGVDPGVAPGICHLAPYAPDVMFDKLEVNRGASTLPLQKLWQIDMVQNGARVSVPSRFTGDGFSVAYTGSTQTTFG